MEKRQPAVESFPGATWLGEGRCRFRVWAPLHEEVTLHILEPAERVVPMDTRPRGYHETVQEDLPPGASYRYRFTDGTERPDPASRHQPLGVHGPSRVVDPAFSWEDDDFQAPAMSDLVLYEIHVGTFTEEGTFDGAARHLEELRELGITAVELMPVAQFPGTRNWGYDGACPWAVQESYGGPDGLRRFVQACHRIGLAVHLDVVYNHLGPEGNYLAEFGPYFTDAYKTPWGPAVNFDGPESDEVRSFFLANALHWVREYHVDGFRLDAIHAIIDRSARPFLEDLSEAMDHESERSGRRVLVVGESNRNDARLVKEREEGGIGLHGLWADDLHHALHALLTGEDRGYYQDFGELSDLEKAYKERFAYAGRYSSFRRRTWGRPAGDLSADRFVVFSQNHDQVGNRLRGDRLSSLLQLSSYTSYQALGLAAMTVLLSPSVPLLFMGEEYGETAPFPYFTSHSDPELAEAVRLGRIQEFSDFHWHGHPPDPQAEETFHTAKLDRTLRLTPGHAQLLALYRELLFLRKTHPALESRRPGDVETQRMDAERTLLVWRRSGKAEALQMLVFARVPKRIHLPLEAGRWRLLLDTTAEGWGGVGSSIPPVMESTGEVVLTVNPWSGLLLERIG